MSHRTSGPALHMGRDFDAVSHSRSNLTGTTSSSSSLPKVLCCTCGTLMESNPTNMCVNCIRSHIDITERIPREATLAFCRSCERYLQPPSFWTKAEFESKEMMSLCLKCLKGLSKVHLVDASFIWTEEHSKRVKLKLQIQKEIFKGAVIQQGFIVEYIIHNLQCEMCQRIATGQPQWDAVCQLRQKVEHRRTFLYLEQLILKNNMHKECTKIQVQPDGLDFFFAHKSHAMRFLDFIGSLVPITRKDAIQLVTQDDKCNTAETHTTYSCEIAPICREDLLCLPKRLSTSLGGIGPIVICHKVHSNIVVVDPLTLRVADILGTYYWKHPFLPLASAKQFTEFYVIDVRILPGHTNGKMQLADITVCLASEVGEGREWITKSHLGDRLQAGDSVMGYLLPSLNCNNDDFTAEMANERNVSDVLLVHKHYPNQKRRRRRRQWKVAQLPKEELPGKEKQQETANLDMEEFLDDLERDAEFRRGVELVRQTKGAVPDGASTVADDDEERLEVPDEELIDEKLGAAEDEEDGKNDKAAGGNAD